MANRIKTRFDYDNLDTCALAFTYALENKKCPECLASISFEAWVEDSDFLFMRITCEKCKLSLEHGTVLDDSDEANELRKLAGMSYVR